MHPSYLYCLDRDYVGGFAVLTASRFGRVMPTRDLEPSPIGEKRLACVIPIQNEQIKELKCGASELGASKISGRVAECSAGVSVS